MAKLFKKKLHRLSGVMCVTLSIGLLSSATATFAGELFPLSDVRLLPGPFLDAQKTDLHYLMQLDPDRLLAPYLREAGLIPKRPSYGNWESSGLDGHMGGHYLSALSLMYASTGDKKVLARLNYFVSELKRCQDAIGTGYLGGIPDGVAAWKRLAQGEVQVDSFSLNGKWAPWYNLHKIFAGLRDAFRYTGNKDARNMLVALSDWALNITAALSDSQMQEMLRCEHGGMNEVLADVAVISGDKKYLALAIRFSHQALLTPLLNNQDVLTGLHANTQIPKVIGFERIGELTGQQNWQHAAQFFWQTVVNKRSVAIGGNSVKEHFHDENDFSPMLDDVEGPETCNTYNMLKLTEMLFLADPKVEYADYYERALYNHILSSQHPGTGGFVYFTPMRPNHYRVYSIVDDGMWCCVGSGLESQAKYGEFIYSHTDDALYVNLFIPSTLNWREKHIRITQQTRFPDQDKAVFTVHGHNKFSVNIRYPSWVAAGTLRLSINHHAIKITSKPGDYIFLNRNWDDGDEIAIEMPMHLHLEQMPDKSNYYAVLDGPIVLAAKTHIGQDEKLSYLADDSRMGHVAGGPLVPRESAPVLISETLNFLDKFKPVKGLPLTFTADGLIGGKDATRLRFMPFFRLHDSRYMIYWPYSTPANLAGLKSQLFDEDEKQQALLAQTIDEVAAGEQQPEVDHQFTGIDSTAGLTKERHWRHASGWFSYALNDAQLQAKTIRLSFLTPKSERSFDVMINGVLIDSINLPVKSSEELQTFNFSVPAVQVQQSQGKLVVKLVAHQGSIAGDLVELRLLK
jgi:DUF1680 family protein